MVRKLKFHEKKLLKKVDFIEGVTKNIREIAIMRKYNINRYEYKKYNELCQKTREIVAKITALPDDQFRIATTADLFEKLYSLGLIRTKRIRKLNELTVKNFARRRLPVYMKESGMINAPLDVIVKYVKHGHVRIGPNVVTDPAFLVTRNHEDFIRWTEKFQQKISEYKDEKDDYVD